MKISRGIEASRQPKCCKRGSSARCAQGVDYSPKADVEEVSQYSDVINSLQLDVVVLCTDEHIVFHVDGRESDLCERGLVQCGCQAS